MEAHNRKPVYYRSTNPNVPQVGEVTITLFQWDETLQMPIEVQNSISSMPPEEVQGSYVIWSDTYTLGYTSELDAAPIFFSNGSVGDDKILSVINHVANRLGLGQTAFTDLATAKAWADGEVRIYVQEDNTAPTTSSGIISSGLIAHLDVSNTSSYSGTGTVWTDLTGNGHNGIVTGSYNSSIASGVFEFDTQGESIEFSQPITKSELSLTVNSEITYQAWVYVPQHTAQSTLFGKGTQTYLQGNYGMNLFTKSNKSDSFSIISDGSQQGQFSTGKPGGTWQLITFQAFVGVPNEQLSPSHSWYDTDRVLTRHYFNDTVRMNVNYPSLDYYVNSGQPNTAAEVGALNVLKDNGFASSNLKIGALYIYNKILTAQEVVDNYNNTKSRFGLS